MEGRKNILRAFEKVLQPSTGHPLARERGETEAKLDIAVVFTSVDPTLAALRRAGVLASSLGARITLVVPQVVPYPAPLESPPVLLDWNERRFRVIAGESPVETAVHIYLCRERMDVLKSVLRPLSLVVLGTRKRWWPTSEVRLARELRKMAHQVILVETE